MGVAASNTTVFLVGHYDFIVPKKSTLLPVLPRRHGAPPPERLRRRPPACSDPWNPKADTPTGPYSVAVGGDHVFVGGEFNRINGTAQPGFAQFALPPSMPPAVLADDARPQLEADSDVRAIVHLIDGLCIDVVDHRDPTATAQTATTATTAKPPTTTTQPPASTTTTTRGGLLGGLFG